MAGISIDTNTGIVTAAAGLGRSDTVTSWLETITATDSLNTTGTTTILVTVNPSIILTGGDTYVVTTHGLAMNSRPFTATQGTPPLRFSIAPSETGVSISQSGVVNIDSSTPAGLYYETVTVTDTVGAIAQAPITLRVNPAITITGFSANGSIYGPNLQLRLDAASYSGSGTTWPDSSGNGHSVTMGNSSMASSYVAGPPSYFTISGGNAFSGQNAWLGGKDFSVSAWIKTTGVGASTAHYGLMTIASAETSGVAGDWGFGIDNAGKLAFGTGGATDLTYSSTVAVNTGRWVYVTATRSYTTGVIKLYINGVLNYTSPSTSNAGYTLLSNSILRIGAGDDGGTPFAGQLGGVNGYNAVLNSDQVLQDYQANVATYGYAAAAPTLIRTTVTIPQTSVALSSTGGTGSLTYAMSPNNLTGITFRTDSMTITADSTTPAGTYYETITGTDSLGVTGSQVFAIIVDSAIAIAPGSTITTTYGIPETSTPYVATLGTDVKHFALSPQVSGVAIDTNTGIITVANNVGNPTALTTYLETITATDSVGAIAQVTTLITINRSIVITGGDTIVVTTHGLAMNSDTFVATYGTSPLRFSIAPTETGVSISQTGIVTIDTTTPAGTYYETITVTDTVGATAQVALTLLVNPSIVVTGIPNGTPTNGLVGYFPFDSASTLGLNIVDGTSINNPNGKVAFTSNGKHGGGALFNGVDAFLTGGLHTWGGSGSPYTISAWVNETQLRDAGIIEFGSQTGPNTTNILYVESNNGVANGWALTGGISSPMPGSTTLLNTWHMVTTTYDLNTMRLYVDGQLVNSVSGVANNNVAGSGFNIGLATEFNNLYFKGTIDDVAIYNRALSASEIQAISGGISYTPSAITTTQGIARSSAAISSTGGTGAMTYAMSPNNLQGITFNSSTGIISADSTTPAGTYYETITATDSLGAFGTQMYSVIVAPSIQVTNGSPVTTTYGIPESSTAFASIYGTGFTHFSILPHVDGINIDTTSGVVSVASGVGSGSTLTTYLETVTATDSVGATGQTTMLILSLIHISEPTRPY